MHEPDCEICPFYWEEHYGETNYYDCGCSLQLDGGSRASIVYLVCYLPIWIRLLIKKIKRY